MLVAGENNKHLKKNKKRGNQSFYRVNSNAGIQKSL